MYETGKKLNRKNGYVYLGSADVINNNKRVGMSIGVFGFYFFSEKTIILNIKQNIEE